MHANNQGQTAAFGVCNSQRVVCPAEDKTCTARRHGTAAAYRRGCRCDIARRAIARYEKRRNLDRLDGHTYTLPNVGALRRLHALRALGYPSRYLAERIGVDERNISRWPHRTWISRAHYEAVCRVYNELADTPGPDVRARRYAAQRGWLPPIWWDDETIDVVGYSPNISMRGEGDFYTDPVAIDRYLSGDRTVRLTRAEKHEAYQRLRRSGHSVTAAAARLRLSGSTARDYEAAMVTVDTHTANDDTGKAGAA